MLFESLMDPIVYKLVLIHECDLSMFLPKKKSHLTPKTLKHNTSGIPFTPPPPCCFCCCLLPVGRHRRSKASGHTMQSRTGTLRPSGGFKRPVFWMNKLLLDDPIPSMCMVYLPTWMVDFYGKCGEIYHTWIVWGWETEVAKKIWKSNFLISKSVA